VPRADYLKHSPFLPIGYLGTLIHLEWPPQSPDLSPIEQIWDYIKSKMDATERSSKEVMWKKFKKNGMQSQRKY
jgi:transposase